MNKTKAAFLFSVEKLFLWPNGNRRRVYMWTFTFREVVSDEIAMKSWNHLVTLLKREFETAPGIRVVEVHPGGHGLHFHALIAARLPVDLVRRFAIRAGFGRIHVQKAKADAAAYLAKYLVKGGNDGLKKGTRRWGFICGFKGTRVKDIEVQSTLADNCRTVRRVVGTWGQALFVAVNQLTAKFGHITEWPVYPEFVPAGEKRPWRSDNEWERPDGCDKEGNKIVWGFVKILDRELGYYVRQLIRDHSTVSNPF